MRFLVYAWVFMAGWVAGMIHHRWLTHLRERADEREFNRWLIRQDPEDACRK